MLAPNVQGRDLERRETQLTIFACTAITILSIGTSLLMYPVVFSRQTPTSDRTLPAAFFGFCALCLLLAGYLWERQSTIRHLRQEMAEERMRVALDHQQASTELLKTLPNFSSFQDRLAMEFRRTVATTRKLSILVVTVLLPQDLPPATSTSLLADAAKVISGKLREQDSIYILVSGCFGVVLPGVDAAVAGGIHNRVAEGLADAAGVNNRFKYKLNVVNFPANAASAHELEELVSASMPGGNSMRDMADAIH